MKIPVYFDFFQTGESETKFNGISLELSNKLFPNSKSTHVIGMSDTNIFLIKQDFQEKFYYPILWDLNGNLEYFSNLTIPNFILNKVNQSRAKILIVNIYEGNNIIDELDKEIIKKYNLPWENIVILSGNKFNYDKINSIYFNFWETYVRFHNRSSTFLYNKAYNLIFNEDSLRQNKFICLQRRPHPLRIALYTELYPYKDDGILTLGLGDDATIFSNGVEQLKIFYENAFEKFKKMNLIETLPAQYDVDTSKENPNFDTDIEKFYNSYLHVVAETHFENANNQIFFSEKVFKPVAHFQPFVMFNQTNSLSEFRSMGFETFPNVIDESYDQIEDNQQRFYSALNSITDFIKRDKRTLHNIMKDIFPVLAHNYYNSWTRSKNNIEQIKSQLILNLYN